jgi:hypothetical protein
MNGEHIEHSFDSLSIIDKYFGTLPLSDFHLPRLAVHDIGFLHSPRDFSSPFHSDTETRFFQLDFFNSIEVALRWAVPPSLAQAIPTDDLMPVEVNPCVMVVRAVALVKTEFSVDVLFGVSLQLHFVGQSTFLVGSVRSRSSRWCQFAKRGL